MGVVIRQSIQSAVATTVGGVLGGLVVAASIKTFSTLEYGFIQNLLKYAVLFSYLGIWGFNYSVIIYGQRYKVGNEQRPAFLRYSFFIPFAFSLVIAAGFLLAEPLIVSWYHRPQDIAFMKSYFHLFPILIAISVSMLWVEAYLMSINKSGVQNFVRDVLLRLINLVLIGMYFLEWISLQSYIYLLVFTFLLPLALLVFLARRHAGFVIFKKGKPLTKTDRRTLWNFSSFHMLGVVTVVLIFQIDVLLIGPYSAHGLADLAVYSVAVFAMNMMRNPSRVVGTAAMPAFTECYDDGKIRKLRSIYYRTTINLQLIAAVMAVLVIVNLDAGVILLAKIAPGYAAVKPLILVLMIGQLFEMGSGLNFEMIGITKKYKFNFWIGICLLAVVFSLNFILIQRYGIFGAAWATTIGLVLFNIVKAAFVYYHWRMPAFGTKSFQLLLLSAAIVALLHFLPPTFNVWLTISYKSLLALGILLPSIYFLKLSKDVNRMVIKRFG